MSILGFPKSQLVSIAMTQQIAQKPKKLVEKNMPKLCVVILTHLFCDLFYTSQVLKFDTHRE